MTNGKFQPSPRSKQFLNLCYYLLLLPIDLPALETRTRLDDPRK
jgi:hypothetical protein